MLAVFGIGPTELIILAVMGGMICLPVCIGVVVMIVLATKNQRRD